MEMNMFEDDILKRLLYVQIPYRLKSVDILKFAIELREKWVLPPPIKIYVEDRLFVEGNLNAFTNSSIEAGLMHCRALLEFLGLCMRNGHIDKIQRRRGSDDFGIEQFRNVLGPLSMVDTARVLNCYEQGRDEAEAALLAVFKATNKGLAHITANLEADPESNRLITIASGFVPWLVVQELYLPLGLEPPDFHITSRPRQE